MALPAPEFPEELFDGNEQDTVNDGAADPQKFQALDYNTLATEIQSLQAVLRDGNVMAVKNDSGGEIEVGKLIRITGFDTGSDLPRVELASAASPSTLADGVALQTISNGESGNMAKQFVQRGLNTDSLGVAGTDLFLSTTPGELTEVVPANAQLIGIVALKSVGAGVITFDVTISFSSTMHALGGSSHTADTLINLNAKVSDATLDDAGDPRTPTAHAIGSAAHTASTLAAINALISDATLDDSGDTRTPASHAVAGAEHSASLLAALNALISDATLDDSGDTRPPSTHGDDHKSSGSDPIPNATGSVGGLESAADKTKLDAIEAGAEVNVAHPIGGTDHTSSTIAELNTKVSDATLDDASSTRPPATHALGGSAHGADTLAALNALITDATLVDAASVGTFLLSNFGSAHVTGTVAAGGGTISIDLTTSDIAGLGVKGIQMSKIRILPSTDCDDYTFEMFRVNTHTGEIDFALENVLTSAAGAVEVIAKGAVFVIDADENAELHIKITNDDPATTPTFAIEIEFIALV